MENMLYHLLDINILYIVSYVSFISKDHTYFLSFQGFMKSLELFLKFQRSYESSTTENEIMRKKLKDSKAAMVNLNESYAQKKSELLLSKERIASLETQLFEDISKA